jgi:hypothetical protein
LEDGTSGTSGTNSTTTSLANSGEACDICGAESTEWLKCKLVCRNCRAIVRSCADL